MAHYIDKDALVAEIDRRRDGIRKGIFSIPLTGSDRASATFEYEILEKIKDFLDTLEVKEVDLENIAAVEWDNYIRKINGEPDNAYMLINRNSYIELAKHFFELGLKAQKG